MRLIGLVAVLCGLGIARGAPGVPVALDEHLEPIRASWRLAKLSDTQYRAAMLKALGRARVLGLWSSGFALRDRLAASKQVRLRDDEQAIENLDGASILARHPELAILPPTSCSYGCCRYVPRAVTSPLVTAGQACFDRDGTLTDLELVRLMPPPPLPPVEVETVPLVDTLYRSLEKAGRCTVRAGVDPYQSCLDTLPEGTAAERAEKLRFTDALAAYALATTMVNGEWLPSLWLAGTDRIGLVRALIVLIGKDFAMAPADVEAVRRATTRPVEQRAWEAAEAFAKAPLADRPFRASIDEASGPPRRREFSTLGELTAATPLLVGAPLACIGRCCRLAVTGRARSLVATEACFDDERRLTSINLAPAYRREPWGTWLLRRVRQDAAASKWSPATRGDACLAATIAPEDTAAVWYCAQRFPTDTPEQRKRVRELDAYLERLLHEKLRAGESTLDYSSYWLGHARSDADRVVREAALDPLARLASAGAVVWIADGPRWRAHRGAEILSRYQQRRGGFGEKVFHLAEPLSCHGACCQYVTPRIGCHLAGPTDYMVSRACFDETGAMTDIDIWVDGEGDLIADPDAP